jgi:acetoin utilization deacetylase AcuC-like enzyme
LKLKTFYHPGFSAPLGDEHPMPIRKFGLVAEELKKMPGVQLLEPEPVTEQDLERVHTRKYIEAIKTGQPRELAESQKFPWSPELFPSVCLTSGGCHAAARAALADGIAAALVSGFHHAGIDHGEGFCTFNGLVVTLEKLQAEGKIRRAAILDLDLHYGNGTAALMEARHGFFALSLYGNDYMDNTAYRDVTERRHQDGYNHQSFPLPKDCNRRTLIEIMDRALPLLLRDGKPDLLLYQAGADPYFEDPYSPLALDHEDLLARDRHVFEFAKANGIPIAWVLAGGYTKDISKIVQVHVNTFRAALEVWN